MWKVTFEKIRILRALNLNPEEVTEWADKIKGVKSNAKRNGHVSYLTFEEYVKLAIDAGITSPSQIGTRIDSYQLGRYGDTGDYEVGNCRFITHKQNLEERCINGGTAIGRIKTWIKRSRKFKVISPDGVEYTGHNLGKFSIDHNISKTNMYLLCRGDINSYKGWIGTYEQ